MPEQIGIRFTVCKQDITYIRRIRQFCDKLSHASLDILKLDNELDGLRSPNLGGVSQKWPNK